jgi:hypothetical protein
MSFDVTSVLHTMVAQAEAGAVGAGFVIHLANGDTSGSHFVTVGTEQPFSGQAQDSAYLELFFTARSAAARVNPDTVTCPDASCVKITGASALAISSISSQSFGNRKWNATTCLFGNWGTPMRLLVAIRDTTVITDTDSIPAGSTINSAELWLFDTNQYPNTIVGDTATVFYVSRPDAGGWSVWSDNDNQGAPDNCLASDWTDRAYIVSTCGDSSTARSWNVAGLDDTTGVLGNAADRYVPYFDSTEIVDGDDSWYWWNVTSFVDSVYNGATTTGNGIVMISRQMEDDGGNSYRNFHNSSSSSNQPVLFIRYTPPAAGEGQVIIIGQEDSCVTGQPYSWSLPSVVAPRATLRRKKTAPNGGQEGQRLQY